MSYGADFVAILAVACVCIGILIGMAIMVCYNKIVCSVPSFQRTVLDHRLSNSIALDTRRDSQFVVVPNHQEFGNSTTLTLAGGQYPNNDQRRIPRVRANSEPAEFLNISTKTLNDLYKKNGRLSRSADVHHESQRTNSTVRTFQSSRGRPKPETINEIPTPRDNNEIEWRERSNNIAGSSNGKGANKSRHHPLWGASMAARLALPTSMQNLDVRREHSNETSDDNDDDATYPKSLAYCAEDIRTIYDPCEYPRTLILRDKKVVFICKMLDDQGGLLDLPTMGISLTVPRGAIPYKQRSLINLVLNWDLSDNPYMDRKEALVSPVVYCGPHGTTFEQPCILRFKHCAFDTRFARILTSETDLFDKKNWQDVDPEEDGWVDEEEEDVPRGQSGVSLSVNECEVQVPHFSLFTCVMKSKSRLLKKWIQVAVFTNDIGPDLSHQQIRIYFLNKTPCALQWAIQNEAKHDFTLACPDTTFLFMESGENMMIYLHYLSDGWEAIDKENSEPRCIFFEEIWHGACPHSSMCFRKINEKRKISGATEMNIGGSGNAANRLGGSGNAANRLGGSGNEANRLSGSGNATNRLDGSGRSAKELLETGKGSGMANNGVEYSEITISLKLRQERCENVISVPLEMLAHNFKVRISDDQVKVIDEGVK